MCVSDSTSGGGSWSPLYGGGGGKAGKLDSDAIQIIHCIYCKDCRMEKLAAEQQAREAQQQQQQGGAMAPGDSLGTARSQGDPGESVPPTSPQISLDRGSLQHTMDKNKESEWRLHSVMNSFSPSTAFVTRAAFKAQLCSAKSHKNYFSPSTLFITRPSKPSE